jgi:nucleosome binding factor SPN SPT16 subunit
MAEIKIDSKLFQERISHFVTAWKNDLRSKDGLFNGAQSLVVMMGKVEEVPEFHKNNAIHVCDLEKPPKSNAVKANMMI